MDTANSVVYAPSGLRRLTPKMLDAQRLGEAFTGADSAPGKILAAFKAAAPYFGYSPRVVHAIDWLFRFTQAQDWAPGSRPIIWPSASVQREDLGLSDARTKALNRHLAELGLITMKDSPSGKRYGLRNRSGHIIEAYGFDLSPLGTRIGEFLAVAARAREIRDTTRAFRRRVTIARKALYQILETAQEHGLYNREWQAIAAESQRQVYCLATTESLEELATGVDRLERSQESARTKLEAQLALARTQSATRRDTVKTSPSGPRNEPHNTSTNQLSYLKDTVIAHEESRFFEDRRGGRNAGAGSGHETGRRRGISGDANQTAPQRMNRQVERTDSGTVMKITPGELVRLAPRLKPYLASPEPNWPDIVEAADWLRHDLGVSKPLWGDACITMGREQAAIALGIVSAKPPEHFRGSPGAYFFGMVSRARSGELNLGRTIWGMRSRKPR